MIITKEIQKIANSIARKGQNYGPSFARNKGCYRFNSATEIRFSDRIKTLDEAAVISHISYGYRKYTTGEYVCKKYLANFGWKNTYYQHAQTVVLLPMNLVESFLR